MELTRDQIKEIILKPKAGDSITSALVFQARHKLHIQGEGYDAWLKKFHEVESKRTIEKKAKLCRPKTPGIYEPVKKQFSKIFRAKGTVVNYNFKSDKAKKLKKEFIDYLRICANGMSIKEWMQQIWHDSMFEEFNGYAAVELATKEEVEEAKFNRAMPILTLYPLACIHDVDQRGYDIKYIVLKKDLQIGNEKVQGYRVIDGKWDAVYYMKGSDLVLNTIDGKDDKIKMQFRKIPFFQISRYRKYPYNDFMKNSPVSKTMDDADLYLSISDDHTVSVKAHQHPIFYTRPAMCVTCNGTGQKYNNSGDIEGLCTTCNGNKVVNILKTDISEGYTLPHVESDDGEESAAQPPCGYVTPELESLSEQRVEMEEQRLAIERGSLGVEGILPSSRTGEKETATGREIDLQPLYDTLNPYSANAEACEEFLTDRMGEVMFTTAWVGSHVHYGRRYFLRSETDVMKELENAHKAGTPRAYIRELIEELYWVRFEGNPRARERAILLLNLEPLPEMNQTDDLLGMAPYIDELKLIIKTNFNDYIERYERENEPIVQYDEDGNFDVEKRVTDISTKLIEYAKQDQKEIARIAATKVKPETQPNGDSGAMGDQ